MYGAIIGDMAGSLYEFSQTKKVQPVFVNNIIEENSFFSDDTILTVAILECILNKGNYEEYIKNYIQKYLNYKPNFEPYFKRPFSPQLIKWYHGKQVGQSQGNGAIMRISPVGYLCNNPYDLLQNSIRATVPSHNSLEAILSAQLVAYIIYYARKGMTKSEIKSKLTQSLRYQPFDKFNVTVKETLPNCLFVLFTSNSYEEAIRKIISYGGDTDTNACIVGSMAEALYGIDNDLISLAKKKLPSEFNSILERGYSKIKRL